MRGADRRQPVLRAGRAAVAEIRARIVAARNARRRRAAGLRGPRRDCSSSPTASWSCARAASSTRSPLPAPAPRRSAATWSAATDARDGTASNVIAPLGAANTALAADRSYTDPALRSARVSTRGCSAAPLRARSGGAARPLPLGSAFRGQNNLDVPARVLGGSSSGRRWAGTGIARFALGTDSAGSGRVPAAFCNVVGLKPTLGSVSTAAWCRPAARSMQSGVRADRAAIACWVGGVRTDCRSGSRWPRHLSGGGLAPLADMSPAVRQADDPLTWRRSGS